MIMKKSKDKYTNSEYILNWTFVSEKLILNNSNRLEIYQHEYELK